MLKKQDYTYAQAFGSGFPTDAMVTGFEPNSMAPVMDPMWVWDKALLMDFLVWWQEGGDDPLYLFGPTGAGKSSALRNFCAALQIPMYEKTVYAGMEFGELIMDKELVDASTINHFGMLPQAMGVNGVPGILVMNEIDRAEEGFLTGMYEILEGQPLIVNNGGVDVIRPEPGFRVAATGNTSMMGDFTGNYVGARQQDLAFLDRFWKVKVGYPSQSVEMDILAKEIPQLPEEQRNLMVECAGDIRAMHMGESDKASASPLTMSTRTLVRWAKLTWAFRGVEMKKLNPMYYALDRALLFAADGMPEVRRAIIEVVNGRFGGDGAAINV